ncbi:glutathione S-transferase family protein [Sphingomonas aerophila]|uniref:Glutathione S-transferase n=1 Tax=Sphingomonas aerophila TaxID=1344948 RepID=A0A7W9BD99_9SPHN|nr:glutathione S-transferase family protein [Sphingomonas aerophila]MBB5715021.1 glutathione S-transferase [Sphingomonas aerophila]
MTLQLFAHPFSSYCWKVMIALHENATPFDLRRLGPDQPANDADWTRLWPLRRMPVLVDGRRTVIETDAILESLDRHYPGPVSLFPDQDDLAVEARMLASIADDFVMRPMNVIVADALRPAEHRDRYGVDRARERLSAIYAWAVGDRFTHADCAAAPALFYADWAHPIDPAHATLTAYRARLLARPCIARCVEDARPYRPFFPLGAPDRD